MAYGTTNGQIVVLNGAPKSGKTRIAAAIQESFEGVWMNLGVDGFMRMTPERFLPGIGLRPGGERPDLEPAVEAMYLALYESVAAHSRLGLGVVVDAGHHDAYSSQRGILPRCARVLSGLPAVLVGVRCPAETIAARRLALGEAPSEDQVERIERWDRAVHEHGFYDLEVDTSKSSPQRCAEAIREYIKSDAEPSTFERLRILTGAREG